MTTFTQGGQQTRWGLLYTTKHKSPKGLLNYLAAVRSEIVDPMNIKLQRDRQIVRKPCNKGAGIIVLDFKEYLKACIDHIEDKMPQNKIITKKLVFQFWKKQRIKSLI